MPLVTSLNHDAATTDAPKQDETNKTWLLKIHKKAINHDKSITEGKNYTTLINWIKIHLNTINQKTQMTTSLAVLETNPCDG